MKKVGLLSLLATLIFAMLLTSCGSAKVNMADYVTVSYSGPEIQNTVYAEMNYDKLEEAVFEEMGIDEETAGDDTDASNERGNIRYALGQSISTTKEPESGVKNGDKVKVTVTFDSENESAKEYGLKIDPAESVNEVTVEGLPKVKKDDKIIGKWICTSIKSKGTSYPISINLHNTNFSSTPKATFKKDGTYKFGGLKSKFDPNGSWGFKNNKYTLFEGTSGYKSKALIKNGKLMIKTTRAKTYLVFNRQ